MDILQQEQDQTPQPAEQVVVEPPSSAKPSDYQNINNVTSPTNPFFYHRSSKLKDILIGVLFLAIVIVLIISGANYISKNNHVNNQRAPSATPTPNPLSGWKTYVDSQTGISFKYPPDFYLVAPTTSGGVIYLSNSKDTFDTFTSKKPLQKNQLLISVTSLIETYNGMQELADKIAGGTTNVSYSTAEINGVKSAKLTNNNVESYGIPINEGFTQISAQPADSDMINTFEQVVKTFTVSAQISQNAAISTAGWKKYTMPHEKLSFIYPPDWNVVAGPAYGSQTCERPNYNCKTITQDSVTVSGPNGFVFTIQQGNATLDKPYVIGQQCPNPSDTCTHYFTEPAEINGKTLFLVITGYKSQGSEQMELGLSPVADCILNCRDGLGQAKYQEGPLQVFAEYPGDYSFTSQEFINDINVRKAEEIMKSLSY